MNNIIEEQNSCLSNAFGVTCYVTKFEVLVPLEVTCEGLIRRANLSSYIEFISDSRIEEFSQGERVMGCVLTQEEYISHADKYKYKGVLVMNSKLRGQLLQVMLKYNGG